MKQAPLADAKLSGRIDPVNGFIMGIKNTTISTSFLQLPPASSLFFTASSSFLKHFMFLPRSGVKSVTRIDPLWQL